MLKFKRKIFYKKSSQETKHSLQMKIFFLSKGFTLICQLSGVLNRSLNVLKQGRVEITHNWIMNKRTINCIGYHLLQLTAYITFLPLYSYIALFQTHFFLFAYSRFFLLIFMLAKKIFESDLKYSRKKYSRPSKH